MPAPLQEPFFNYFGDNYRWSHGLLLALGAAAYGGADIGEVHRIGRELAGRDGDDDAWFEAWCDMGEALMARAQKYAEDGRTLTAAGAALRACNYLQVGERFKVHKDEAALEAYRHSLEAFRMYAELGDGPRIEAVEVPYEDGSLPAYFVHPRTGEAPHSCVVFFDGLDITKEIQYLRGVEEFSRRGIACLVVDGPGNGESIRFRGHVMRYDCDVAGTAALDHLARRPDADETRTAVMGISLGGYFAARCAARESRFAACVVWGAIWDYHRTWTERLAASFDVPMSVAGHHIAWAFGVDTPEEALTPLENWRLEGVARDITMPVLVLHGEDDRQVALEDARALFDEIGSQDKTLRVYPKGEPGAQHCQIDYPAAAITEIADWLKSRLAPGGRE